MALDLGAGAKEKKPGAIPELVLKMLQTEDESAAGLDKIARFISEVAAVTEEGSATARCPLPVFAMRVPPLLL